MKGMNGCLTVFTGMFYVVGFALLGYGLWSARRSTQASAWPTAPATITNLELQEDSGGEDTTYEVKVRYTYAVDGVEYNGSRLAFGYVASSEPKPHEEIQRKLQEAQSINARYNPSDPSVSCLSFGMHRSILALLAFAITWLVFIGGISLLFWLSSGSDAVLLDNLSVR